MFCHNCGHEMSSDRKFCTKCGTKVELSGIEEPLIKAITKNSDIHHNSTYFQSSCIYCGKTLSTLEKINLSGSCKKCGIQRKTTINSTSIFSELNENQQSILGLFILVYLIGICVSEFASTLFSLIGFLGLILMIIPLLLKWFKNDKISKYVLGTTYLSLFFICSGFISFAIFHSNNKSIETKTPSSYSNSERKETVLQKTDSDIPFIKTPQSFGKWKIQAKELRIADHINETGSIFELNAEEGTILFVIDLVFVNISNETASLSSFWEPFKITCKEGYVFSENISDRISLNNALDDADILPGIERRGKIVIKVRDDITDPIFEINFMSKTLRWRTMIDERRNLTLREILNEVKSYDK